MNVLNALGLGGNLFRLGHGGGSLRLVIGAVLRLRRNRVLLIQRLDERCAQNRVAGQHNRHDQGTDEHGTAGGDGALGRTQRVGERKLTGLSAGDHAEGTYQRGQHQRGDEEDRNTEQQCCEHAEEDCGVTVAVRAGCLIKSSHNSDHATDGEEHAEDRADLTGLADFAVGVLAHRANR